MYSEALHGCIRGTVNFHTADEDQLPGAGFRQGQWPIPSVQQYSPDSQRSQKDPGPREGTRDDDQSTT